MKRWMTSFTMILIAAVAMPLLFISCSPPPYEEGLSLAMRTAEKMALVRQIGPMDASYDNQFRGKDTYFIPSKNDILNLSVMSPLRGFMVVQGQYNARLYPVTTNTFFESYGTSFPINNDPHAFKLAFSPLKVLIPPNVLSMSTVVFDIQNHGIFYTNVSGENISMVPPAVPAQPEFQSGSRIIGMSFVPDSTLNDFAYILWYDSSNDMHETIYQTTDAPSAIIVPSSEIRTGSTMSLPNAGQIQQGFYGYHPGTQMSYFSYYNEDDEKYLVYRWNNDYYWTLKIDKRIDAVLSNGCLYCTDGPNGYVYDGEGNEITHFPLGNLRLAYEIVGADGIGTLYFTLVDWQGSENQNDSQSSDQVTIYVYSLPTSRIGKL